MGGRREGCRRGGVDAVAVEGRGEEGWWRGVVVVVVDAVAGRGASGLGITAFLGNGTGVLVRLPSVCNLWPCRLRCSFCGHRFSRAALFSCSLFSSFSLLLPPSTVSFAPSSGGSARYAVPIFFRLLSVVPFASDELPGPRLSTTRLYTHYISSGASTGGSPHHPARRVLRPRLRLYYFSLPIYFLGAPDRGPPTTRPTGFPSVSPPQYYRAPTARQ